MKAKSDKPKETSTGEIGWIHRLTDDIKPFIRQPKPPKILDAERHATLAPYCRKWFVDRGERVEELATLLGVAAWTIDVLKVGWDGNCWTLPELNHNGMIVGCQRRFADGKKLSVAGMKATRGLCYADDWSDTTGPVFIVEGASDTAAGMTMGLCVVGRPSNTGGIDYLAKLLRNVAATRKIVFVAERDKKENLPADHNPKCAGCARCWPGKWGAVQSSMQLSNKLAKEHPVVRWTFMPDGAKDMRCWLNKIGADVEEEEAMTLVRKSLLRRIGRMIHA